MTTTSKTQPQSPPPGQYVALQLRAKESADGGPLVITGIANDANTTDSYGTRIKVSQRALDGYLANPVLLLNHDMHNPIGTVRTIGYQNGQLRAEAEIHPDAKTNTGASVADLIRSGVLRAFSIRIDEITETRNKEYTQLDADVMDELSVVTLPSNRPSLFQMRSKGIQIHGAEELLEHQGETMRAADRRTQDKTRAAGPLNLDLLTQRLQSLIRAEKGNGGDDYYWSGSAYLVAVYDDVVVWTEYYTATSYQQGYAVDDAGAVTLVGPEQEVLPSWTVVGAATEPAERAISEADMGAVVGEVLLRVRTQLGLDAQGEPVLRQGAISRALESAGVKIEAAEPTLPAPADPTPPAIPPTPDPEPEITLDDVREAIRFAASAPPAPK